MSTQDKPAARWYVVANKNADDGECLVEASNRAQAFRRAGEYYCTARPAAVADSIRIMENGCDIITAPTGPEQLDLEEALSDPPAEPLPAGPLEGEVMPKSEMRKAAEVFGSLPATEPDAT
jgi:hypothetical protein